jgi:hypothetical protein
MATEVASSTLAPRAVEGDNFSKKRRKDLKKNIYIHCQFSEERRWGDQNR